MKNQKLIYANEWERSALHFFNNGDYEWAASFIRGKKKILEIGCGAGYSTLSILQQGATVISVDNNDFCIQKTQFLLSQYKVFAGMYRIIDSDLFNFDQLYDDLSEEIFDVVTIWNTGQATESNDEIALHIGTLKRLGYTKEQVINNYACSWTETMINFAALFAIKKNASLHIIERYGSFPSKSDLEFYEVVKENFGFKTIKFDYRPTTLLSSAGKKLVINGIEQESPIVKGVLVSIFIGI